MPTFKISRVKAYTEWALFVADSADEAIRMSRETDMDNDGVMTVQVIVEQGGHHIKTMTAEEYFDA